MNWVFGSYSLTCFLSRSIIWLSDEIQSLNEYKSLYFTSRFCSLTSVPRCVFSSLLTLKHYFFQEGLPTTWASESNSLWQTPVNFRKNTRGKSLKFYNGKVCYVHSIFAYKCSILSHGRDFILERCWDLFFTQTCFFGSIDECQVPPQQH